MGPGVLNIPSYGQLFLTPNFLMLVVRGLSLSVVAVSSVIRDQQRNNIQLPCLPAGNYERPMIIGAEPKILARI